MIAIPINWSSNEPDTEFATQGTKELLHQFWPTCFHQTDDNSDQITILRGFFPYPLFLNCQQKWFGLCWQHKRWRWYDEDHFYILKYPQDHLYVQYVELYQFQNEFRELSNKFSENEKIIKKLIVTGANIEEVKEKS